jgi:hypothetical protein
MHSLTKKRPPKGGLGLILALSEPGEDHFLAGFAGAGVGFGAGAGAGAGAGGAGGGVTAGAGAGAGFGGSDFFSQPNSAKAAMMTNESRAVASLFKIDHLLPRTP